MVASRLTHGHNEIWFSNFPPSSTYWVRGKMQRKKSHRFKNDSKTVVATFVGNHPKSHHHSGITLYISRLVLRSFDENVIAAEIIKNSIASTVLVNQSSDKEIFGVSAVLQLNSPNERNELTKDWIPLRRKICRIFQKKFKNSQDIVCNQTIATSQIGWLLNERALNLPPDVSKAVFWSLGKDLDRANKIFGEKVDYLFYLTKCYMNNEQKGSSEDLLIFCNEEDKLFMKNSMCFTFFSVNDVTGSASSGMWNGERELASFRCLMFFTIQTFHQVVAQIRRTSM